MKYNPSHDILYQLFALILSFILVHAVYVTIIRPNAEAQLEEQRRELVAGTLTEIKRSVHIILKDPEQESCFVLGFWVFAIIGQKARTALHERKLLSQALLDVTPGTSILPEDARTYSRTIQTMPDTQREYLLPRTLLAVLQRFGSTRSIQDASTAIREICDAEFDRLDSELAMVRYIIWAIPAIGFVGTVRGIGQALTQAHKAVQGDIIGVTIGLGVSFNSTLVALLLSIVIMFLMHQLQLLQERLVLDTQNYCDVNLIRHLQIR